MEAEAYYNAHNEYLKAKSYFDVRHYSIMQPKSGDIFLFNCREMDEGLTFFDYAKNDGNHWKYQVQKQIKKPGTEKVMAIERKYYRFYNKRKDPNCVKYLVYFEKSRMGLVHYIGDEIPENSTPHGNTIHHTQPFRPTHQIAKDVLATQNKRDSTRDRRDALSRKASANLLLSPDQHYYHSVKKFQPAFRNEAFELLLLTETKNKEFKKALREVCSSPVMYVVLATEEAKQEMQFIVDKIKAEGLDILLFIHFDTSFNYGGKYVSPFCIRHPFLRHRTPTADTLDQRAIYPFGFFIHKDRYTYKIIIIKFFFFISSCGKVLIFFGFILFSKLNMINFLSLGLSSLAKNSWTLCSTHLDASLRFRSSL